MSATSRGESRQLSSRADFLLGSFHRPFYEVHAMSDQDTAGHVLEYITWLRPPNVFFDCGMQATELSSAHQTTCRCFVSGFRETSYRPVTFRLFFGRVEGLGLYLRQMESLKGVLRDIDMISVGRAADTRTTVEHSTRRLASGSLDTTTTIQYFQSLVRAAGCPLAHLRSEISLMASASMLKYTHWESLKALAMATSIYKTFSTLTIPLSVVTAPVCEARWLPGGQISDFMIASRLDSWDLAAIRDQSQKIRLYSNVRTRNQGHRPT